MSVCLIDEDFTIDVVEDPEVCVDDEHLRRLLEESEKESTNRISENGEKSRSKTIVTGVFEKVEPADEKITCQENPESTDKKWKPSKKYECDSCNYCTNTLAAYYVHVQGHLDPSSRLLKCSKCHFSTFSKSSMSQHMNQHVPKEKWVKCPHCDFTTVRHRNLRVHLKKTHVDGKKKQYKCLQCPFVTESREDLEKHRKESHNKLKCNLCGFWSKTKGAKRKHMEDHGIQPKMHKCDFCHYKSKYPSHVVKHQNIHIKNLEMK